ncbi:MAG: tRNA epoxyqueuosine(34) reductase QueG [Terracidiphilus sp.]
MDAKADNLRDLAGGLARELALRAGFSEAGLVALPHANEARNAARFREWVNAGRAASMRYLARTAESGELLRERVGIPFPWARSAQVCFASYLTDAPLSTETQERGSAWIARYAWSGRPDASADASGRLRPSDYHKVLLKRMRKVEAELHARFGEFESRAFVDTGPVVERALAAAAGLGWIGKNTCVIHPRLGSFGFLAVLLTSVEVSEGASQRASGTAGLELPDRCGTCTRCIDACPTNALTAPYQMDASRCISYLTIEHKGPIAEELMEGMGRQVFGCDICQDVCPLNGKALRQGPVGVDAELEPRAELINPALDWLGSLDEKSFERSFNGSPVRRAGFAGLRRNVAVAMGNSGLARFAPQLEAWAQEADEGLHAAAKWALGKVRANAARVNRA